MPDFARDYIIDCPGCQHRKVVHATDWPQATIRLIKQGWMQTVSGGWLCPKCVGPDERIETSTYEWVDGTHQQG